MRSPPQEEHSSSSVETIYTRLHQILERLPLNTPSQTHLFFSSAEAVEAGEMDQVVEVVEDRFYTLLASLSLLEHGL
jgi:hypothetical protein